MHQIDRSIDFNARACLILRVVHYSCAPVRHIGVHARMVKKQIAYLARCGRQLPLVFISGRCGSRDSQAVLRRKSLAMFHAGHAGVVPARGACLRP